MQTGFQYKIGMTLHAWSGVPFLFGFATNNWVAYNGTERNHYGLWTGCKEGNSSEVDEEICRTLNIHELPAFFHLARTVFCLALISFAFGFLSKRSFTCNADDTKLIKQNLFVSGAVCLFVVSGALLFNFAKDDYDKQIKVNSSYRPSAITIWAVGGVNIFSIFLISLPLLDKCCKICKKNTDVSDSTTESSTSSSAEPAQQGTAASTTVAVASRARRGTRDISPRCIDLSMVEIPKPPPYSERDSNSNAWFNLDVARSRNVDTSTNAGPNSQTSRRDSSIGGQDSNSRPGSRGIFTVLVNPAPPCEQETGNIRTPAQINPSVLPPRYEDISPDYGLQSSQSLRPPTAPPPSYESITSGENATSGLLQLDSRQLTGSRGPTSLPVPQSDV